MCSISLRSDSVVVVGPFIVLVEVIEIEPAGVVGALSVVVMVGHVCASTSLGVVAFRLIFHCQQRHCVCNHCSSIWWIDNYLFDLL